MPKVKYIMKYKTYNDIVEMDINTDGKTIDAQCSSYVDDRMLVIESGLFSFNDYAYIVDNIDRKGMLFNIPFFEGDGNIYRDISKNNYTASLISGTANWCKVNDKYAIDLKNATIIINNFEITISEFTLLLWIYPVYFKGFINLMGDIINVGIVPNEYEGEIYYSITVANVGIGLPYFYTELRKWQQICCSWSSFDGVVKTYVDGKRTSRIYVGITKGKKLNINTYYISKNYGGNNRFRICLAKMYNKRLSDNDIYNIYKTEKELLGV